MRLIRVLLPAGKTLSAIENFYVYNMLSLFTRQS